MLFIFENKYIYYIFCLKVLYRERERDPGSQRLEISWAWWSSSFHYLASVRTRWIGSVYPAHLLLSKCVPLTSYSGGLVGRGSYLQQNLGEEWREGKGLGFGAGLRFTREIGACERDWELVIAGKWCGNCQFAREWERERERIPRAMSCVWGRNS